MNSEDNRNFRRLTILLKNRMSPEAIDHWFRMYVPYYDATPQMLLDDGKFIELLAILNWSFDG